MSERDGWRHIYLAGRDDKSLVRLTDGDFDVQQIEAVDEKHGMIYFAASPDNPTQRYLYRIPISGGKAERLTPTIVMDGTCTTSRRILNGPFIPGKLHDAVRSAN